MGLPHTKAPRTTRAELIEAMNHARPLAAQLRAAQIRRAALGPAPMLKAAGAMRETISAIRADIRSVAHNAYLEDEEPLICLLTVEDALRTAYRRKPSLDQITKALGRHIGDMERQLLRAHEVAAEAQRALDETTRETTAANAAGALLGIAA